MSRKFKCKAAGSMLHTSSLLVLFLLAIGCTFNFELTSQKTALENQIMGTYKEMDDELVLISTVRSSGGERADSLEARHQMAQENRKFNRDDIDELKQKRILGEANDGRLAILGKDVYGEASEKELKLARLLQEEENRDREIIWRFMVANNPNLTEADLPKVRQSFAESQREAARSGDWIQGLDGTWTQFVPKTE